jgi:multidrug efflux pump
MVGIVLVGILAYRFLPISALPTVDFPTIQIVSQYPGADPDVMASLVTAPLEKQFGQISGLTAMSSISSFGTSVITLQFTLGRKIDEAGQDVQAAINAAGGLLPPDMPNPPVFNKVNPADTPILTLAITSDSLPLDKINDYADSVLAQKLSEVSGVGLVTIQGNQKPAIRVRLNPAALSAQGLALEDVRTAISQANVNAPKGSFDGEHQSYTIGSNDQILTADEFKPIILTYRNGAPVRLADVADVQDGVENSLLAAWLSSPTAPYQPCVLLDIQRQPGANIIDTVERIKSQLRRLTASVPPGIHVSIFSDRTETIRASVSDVQFTLVLSIGLVVLVLLLFLRRIRTTIIPATAVPLSLLGTFAVMYLAGFSLDNLSLMALTISTGFVVDDAIVMVENIFRYIEEGDSPLTAAFKGSRQIGFTVISLSLSLIAVFIPLLFMPGIVGRLFREFAITLSTAVIVSALVSLTLAPMMAAKMLRREEDQGENAAQRATAKFFDAFLSLYDRTLVWALGRQRFVLTVAAATLVATGILFYYIPKGLLPLQDTGLIIGVTDAAQDISFPAMLDRQKALTEIVRQDPDVLRVAGFVGAGTVNSTPNTGRLYIVLKPREDRKSSAGQVIARLRKATRSVQGITLFLQPAQDLQIDTRVSRTQYQYTLEDANFTELNEWSDKLLAKLRTLPQLVDVASDQQTSGLQLHVDVDRTLASRLNVQIQAIDDTLYDAFGQRQISVIFTQLNQYRVVLEVSPEFRESPDALDKIYVKATTGNLVPLSAFAKMTVRSAPLVLTHQWQFPSATLSFNLQPGYSLGDAVRAINEARKEIGMPNTIVAEFYGTAAEFQSSLKNEPFLILAAIIVIYIVLGVLYESYIHPLTILSTLPSAGVGALLTLWICQMDFSLVALIGIILLIGIVKKNAIMMIDFAIEAQRDGLPPREAIYQACLLRFRPIMMTTAAALLGAVPLAFQTGTGSELRQPLGIAIVGGLLVSQFFTLYTTPVIYLYLDRFERWVIRGRKREDEVVIPNPDPVVG